MVLYESMRWVRIGVWRHGSNTAVHQHSEGRMHELDDRCLHVDSVSEGELA